MKKIIIVTMLILLISFVNAKNEFKDGAELEIDGKIKIKVKNPKTKVKAAKENGKQKFKEILTGVDIEYTETFKQIKEDIIFKKEPKFNKIEFDLDIGNNNYKITEDGDLVIYEGFKPIGRFKQPFIVENNQYLPYTFDGSTYTIDLQYIDWDSLSFPVIVDPTFDREDFYWDRSNSFWFTDGIEGDISLNGSAMNNGDNVVSQGGWTSCGGTVTYSNAQKTLGNVSIGIGNSECVSHTAHDNSTFTGSVGINYYDDGDTTTDVWFEILPVTSKNTRMGACNGFGGTCISYTKYTYYDGSSIQECDENTIARTTGWHNMTFVYFNESLISGYIDGVLCHNFTTRDGFKGIRIHEPSNQGSAYFDEVWVANGDKPGSAGDVYKVDSVRIDPLFPLVSQNLTGYATGINLNSSFDATYEWIWFRNDTVYREGNGTTGPSETEINLDNITSTETKYSETWILSVRLANGSRNSTYVNSSEVTITQSSLDNCSNYQNIPTNVTVLNVSFYDTDGDLTEIDFQSVFDYGVTSTTEQSYGLNENSQTGFSLCMYPEQSQLLSDYVIYYNNMTYFGSSTFTNDSIVYINITVQTDTYPVTFTVQDYDDNEIEGAIIKILKWDLTSNSYLTTEIIQTDIDGQAVGQLELATAFYKFIVEYQNSVYLTYPETQGVRQYTQERTFRIDLGETQWFDNFIDLLNVSNDVTFNNATSTFNFIYNDNSGTIDEGCLKVVKRNQSGDTTLSDSCVSSTAANIVYTITPTNFSTFIGTGYFNYGSETYTGDTETVRYGGALVRKDSTNFAVLLSLFIVLGLTLLGIHHPFTSYIGLGMGLIAVSLLQWWLLSLGAIVGILIVGGIHLRRFSGK